MVCRFAEFQQVAHAEALAGFPFVAVFVMLGERDVVERASALGEVFPHTSLDVAVAYMMKGFDFIHMLSFLQKRLKAGRLKDNSNTFKRVERLSR